MAENKTYAGGCHCGKVRYEVTADLSSPVIECNCSICSKKGTLLTFVPRDAIKVLSGENEQSEYQFNKMNIHHLFCRTCGVTSYATGTGPDGKPMAAINVRCLDDVELSSLKRHMHDGKSA
jgi:hypothetical protein